MSDPSTPLNSTVVETAAQSGEPLPFNFLIGWLSWLLPLLNNTGVQDSLRFLIFGSVIETGRRTSQWLIDRFTSGFFVTAHFGQGDYAFDWLNEFLAAQEIWTNSHEYRVTASNTDKEWACSPGASASTDKSAGPVSKTADGAPRPLYFPASDMPQVMRWRGHWIQVTRRAGSITYSGGGITAVEENASITLTVYTRKKRVLDDLVEEARQYYLGTNKPPLAAQTKRGSALTLKATFSQGDWTFDWLTEFLSKRSAWDNANEVNVTAKTSASKWGMNLGGDERDERLQAFYQPVGSAPHLWKYKDTWIQIQRFAGSKDYRTGREEGASLMMVLFTTRKQTLDDLVAEAAQEYWENSRRRVTVHMAESYGDWGMVLQKQIRPMDSVILPSGVIDHIVEDLKEFIHTKDWYTAAGIPWRRGVLLWGAPGTGKSTTVHAIAGELQLEIYFISLALQGLDDSYLQRLVSSTPPNCIILLEDIDCAFPSREIDEEELNEPFNPYSIGQTKSNVTLSGLLNLLDSVSSEEGRIVFATTNHIDRLDPALLRPGRMDLQIEYKLASQTQATELFERFYAPELLSKSQRVDVLEGYKPKVSNISEEAAALIKNSDRLPLEIKDDQSATVSELAKKFGEKITPGVFSIAQLQNYLLSKKRSPQAAVEFIDVWVKEKDEERIKREERLAARRKERTRYERIQKRRAEKEKQEEEEEERRLEKEAEELAAEEEKLEKEADEAEGKEEDAKDGDKLEEGSSDSVSESKRNSKEFVKVDVTEPLSADCSSS